MAIPKMKLTPKGKRPSHEQKQIDQAKAATEKKIEELREILPPPKDQTKTGLPPPVKKTKVDFSKDADRDAMRARLAKLSQQQASVVRHLVERNAEALSLYEPLGAQDEFHSSNVRTRLLRGSNRGGKTLPAGIELARAVTRSDPYGKFPLTGVAYVVGKDWTHIGETIYPKLCLPGAFKVIRDLETGFLRAYRPWDLADRKRQEQAKDAEPLIPPRLIQGMAWEEKKKQIPSQIILRTGWKILFFSGNAEWPQGGVCDFGWLDEEIPKDGWYTEINSRVVDRNGRIVWSATPQVGTDVFYDLCTMASTQKYLEPEYRDVQEFHILLKDNPHISEKAKADMAAVLSDEEKLIRVGGEFATAGRVIWPEYSKRTHLIEAESLPKNWTNWTHYAVVDPGRTVCAALFASVPDPSDVPELEEPFDLLLWDEMYQPKCNARIFGEQFFKKTEGKHFEAFVIDMHGARITDMGSGLSVYDQYCDALLEKGVFCRRTKNRFLAGDDDVKGCIEKFRSYLLPSKMTGLPRVRILGRKIAEGRPLEPLLPNLDYEMMRWKYKVISQHPTDEPETRGRVHLMACCRYLAGLKPKHVVVTGTGRRAPDHPLNALEKFRRMMAARTPGSPGNATLNLGPAGVGR